MYLFGTDRVLLREIAEGLSSVNGGRVDSLLPLIGAGLVAGERASTPDDQAFLNVVLTRRGHAYLYPQENDQGAGQPGE